MWGSELPSVVNALRNAMRLAEADDTPTCGWLSTPSSSNSAERSAMSSWPLSSLALRAPVGSARVPAAGENPTIAYRPGPTRHPPTTRPSPVMARTTGHNLAVRYRFDDSVLGTTRYQLSRGGDLLHVEPQVFDVLAHLVERRDRVVAKAELLDGLSLRLTAQVELGTPGPCRWPLDWRGGAVCRWPEYGIGVRAAWKGEPCAS
jgi:hypothetical protein